MVKEKYEKEKAHFGLDQVIEFESNEIALDIPNEGMTIGSWKVTPLVRPVVSHQ